MDFKLTRDYLKIGASSSNFCDIGGVVFTGLIFGNSLESSVESVGELCL